ncbi:MAG: OmpA family protein [Verrucomicrobia bacterium]|nr:OmpA family protein [Verrucomicrobiota bacterium]
MLKDAVMFSGNTVFFDLDKATIKKTEQKKIDEVAAYLKSSGASANKMLVEGHCDERGTEEYNRALGERRALAVREYLVRAGVGPDRVYTRSYGEDRPADPGHNEAAWSKNRRGDFILLKPKPLL